MTNSSSSYKLKCQLSDQKQTPVYFPINEKEQKYKQNISIIQKKEFVNIYMGIDLCMSTILVVIIALYLSQNKNDEFPTSNINSLFKIDILKTYKVRVPVVLFYAGGWLCWELFKNSTGFEKPVFHVWTFLYFLSSLLGNVCSLFLCFIYKTLDPALQTTILATKLVVFLGVIKYLHFNCWTLE
tara:strand:- start:243 stop:794 length:552 start_codon:yes stop_codon:yes gene_type:complete